MDATLAADVGAVGDIDGVDAILLQVCALTGMRFAAVARVTETRWIACQILDKIDFGLTAGDELEVGTTICNEIRQSRESVFIDSVNASPMWLTHPTPVLYGFKSYISVPIILADGSFFGTLCALDPEARLTSMAPVVEAIKAMAQALAAALDARPTAALPAATA